MRGAESAAAAADVEAAAWLVEQLEIEAQQPGDRSRIRRALEEAAAAWPGPSGERWWRWTVEAAESLSLKCRVLDCTLEQICEIAREGGRVLIREETTGGWWGIAGARGRKFLTLHPLTDEQRQWLTAGRLRDCLQAKDRGAIIRCVVLEPQLEGGLSALEHESHLSPLARTLALLRPEWGDIWVLILFALVAGFLALATPLAIEALVSTVTFGRMLQPVVVLSLMLFGFLAFQAAIKGLQSYVVEIIQRRLFARVAADLAFRLPRTQYEALHAHDGRELVNRFFDVVTVQKVASQFLLEGLTVVLNTIIGMAVLGFYHPWLLGFDVVLIGMIAFTILVLGRGAVSTSIQESKCKYHMASWLEDLAGCPIAFRYDGAPQFALERADRLTYDYLSARRRHFRVVMRQIIFALGLQAIASTVLLGMGGWLVIAGQLTLGQLVAAELIVTVIVGSFAKLGKHMESYYDLMAAMDKLGHLFDLPIEKQDGMLTIASTEPAEVLLEELDYHYPDGRGVFHKLNLSLPRGARCVVTGSSGSGKSVLLDLLFGLRHPAGGHVLINGIEPRELRPDVLRQSVALVRDIEVFEGTLAENVHLERPDVGTGDVRDALHAVGLLGDVLALPDGLDTELNATGYPLTPNQLRKLMLARAIVGRPTLLLIDGTLDPLTDGDAVLLMRMLSAPQQPWTLLMVTGRAALTGPGTEQIQLQKDSAAPALPRRLPQETHHAH